MGTLLRSVSVNLAELRRAPATGGWGFPRSRDALMRGFGIFNFECLIFIDKRLLTPRPQRSEKLGEGESENVVLKLEA